MNLSIHPAPIDRPTVPQIANEQTGEASVLQCAKVKRRLVKLAVIINPASDYRVKHARQIFNRLIGHSVNPPPSDGSAYGFSCLIAHHRKNVYRESSISIF
jgi:hypothetical protein